MKMVPLRFLRYITPSPNGGRRSFWQFLFLISVFWKFSNDENPVKFCRRLLLILFQLLFFGRIYRLFFFNFCFSVIYSTPQAVRTPNPTNNPVDIRNVAIVKQFNTIFYFIPKSINTFLHKNFIWLLYVRYYLI